MTPTLRSLMAPYRRASSLTRSEQRLVFEAAISIAIVAMALRLFRFTTARSMLRRLGAVTRTTRRDAPPAVVDAVRWAVDAVGARVCAANCLVRALAADLMLRRRSIRSEVRFGVRARTDGAVPIEAHAWVETDSPAEAVDHEGFTALTLPEPR